MRESAASDIVSGNRFIVRQFEQVIFMAERKSDFDAGLPGASSLFAVLKTAQTDPDEFCVRGRGMES
jgi:hypothetical protein